MQSHMNGFYFSAVPRSGGRSNPDAFNDVIDKASQLNRLPQAETTSMINSAGR